MGGVRGTRVGRVYDLETAVNLGSLSSWIADMERQAGGYVGKAESYIINSLVQFRDKRGALNFAISKLKKNAPLTSAPENVKAAYVMALAQANDAKLKADWLGRIADEFTNITGLGVLPALIAGVPVAVMLAAVASLVYLISKAVSEISRYVNAKTIAETAGGGAAGAAAAQRYLDSSQGGGLFGDASQLVWPIAIAGVAYLLITGKRR